MEDGDDDTSVTIARQKLEEDDRSSEKDTLVSKNENKELSSGVDCNLVLYSDEDVSKELSSEELNVSSTSQSDENTFVASTPFDNALLDSTPSNNQVSSTEGENKCISGPSEPNVVSDALNFVDGNELPHVAGESSPASSPVENETPLSEEVNRTVPQDDFSEADEDQNEKLCFDEANRIPSFEQTGNGHSSLQAEEEGEEEEEAMEEEEEGEQEHQTNASSKELASSPEGFSQHVDEYCKKSGNEYKECNNDLDKNINELLIGTDLPKEINADDKDFQDENNFERKRDICPEKGDNNENVESINEIGVKKDHIEYFSTEEKGIVKIDCTQETNDQKTISDYISTEVTEKDMLDEVKTSDVQEVTEETCENETEEVVFQTNVDKENKQANCEKVHEFDNFVPGMVENTSVSNDQSTAHCSNNITLDNEKMETESGQLEEYCMKQDINVIESNQSSKEIDVLDDTCSNMEMHSEIRLTEQSIETSTENMPCDTNFEDSDMHEIGREMQSSDSDSDSGKEYEEEICSPQTVQDKEHENHECNESKRNDISCIKEPKGLDKVENADIPLKVNGEVEISKASLLNNKDSNASTKDKVSLKRKLEASPAQDISSDISISESVKGNIQFKGFKKRYIAQVSEVSSKDSSDVLSPVQDELRLKSKRSAKKLVLESSQLLVSHQPLPDGAQANTPLTEYAQYLGLQPTVKFKCYNCGESGFPSMLKLQEHQNTCLKNIRIHSYNKPPPSPIIEPAPSTNFRITRKVYLCSACGTYYENWNLFLHMREVHNRHICLFCLLMFSQADKLAQHLSGKHGIADTLYSSPEQFLDEFKGSFFLTCCTCEQMFSEGDDFCDHMCKDTSLISTDQACSLCGLKGAHFPTCRRAFTDSNSLISPSQSNSQNIVANSSSDTSQNAQLGMQEKPIVASKYLVQNEKATSGRKSLHKLPEQNVERPDKSHHSGDDDYDISDAASYCHVNIHEPDKQKVENLEGKIINKAISADENDDLQKIDDVPSRVESSSISLVSEEIAEDNDNENKVENNTKSNDISQNESQEHVEKLLTQHTEVTAEENTEMEASEKSEFPSSLSSSNNEVKKNEVQLINLPKSPKVGEYSESDSSASGGDSHESEGSSSSSDVSSDENEQEEKEPEKVLKSEDSDMEKSDSDKMSIVVDEGRSEDEVGKQVNANDDRNNSNITENEANEISEEKSVSPIDSDFKMSDKPFNNNDVAEELQDNIQIAGDDVPLLELTLEENLDALPIQTIVKECVKISCSTCVYCNHAKKIAVNGKQLVLHLLAEHRFEPVVCSDSGELTPIFGFVENLKAKLSQLQNMFFNTDSYDSGDKNFTRSYDRTYECFHCHFITTLHKELYVHNRKMHQKTILLCIMCKSNFYSYSELLCHLCPGIYVPDSNILFRCCLCVVDGLPSAFRLMVHLRKRHHACDVCLETTGDQQKLSNHVWKHKLHHLCYRCGIAYRNKPDITKHLFWKHGTESVLCKKCLQKKWPHVYHFCIPPTAFLCEECNASFSRAVALKVHKRLHTGDVSYQCEECEEKFISKKLLKRHKEKHKVIEQTNNEKIMEQETQDLEPCEMKSCSPVREYHETNKDVKEEGPDGTAEKSNVLAEKLISSQVPQEIPKEQDEAESNNVSEDTKHSKKSKVVDVYDLPPLNLSSESDESDNEQSNNQLSKDIDLEDSAKTNVSESPNEGIKIQDKEVTEEEVQPVQIVDGVWDNFKTYKANLEKREILQAQATGSLKPSFGDENSAIVDVVMADHDYCVLSEKPPDENNSHQAGITSQTQSHCDAVAAKEANVNLDDKGSGFGADHNYCFNTSPHSEDKKDQPCLSPHVPSTQPQEVPPVPSSHSSLPSIPVSPPLPPSTPPIPVALSPKKKQKSPKKKQKQSGSSSSSDSSSNSDSSSCTCGTNCSCSSSSSSSSGSSSTSSDSDSSSSEGRRRQAARRDRRRERAKRKTETESKSGTPPPVGTSSTSGAELGEIRGTTMESTLTRLQIDSSGAGSLQIDDTPLITGPEPEDHEFLICESDLDTTETETDEDFYDKYPQKQANKLLAEKRNQLLLLAAVAPVNNGTITQPSPPPPPKTPEPVQKKKVKTKRHKKSQHNNSEKKVESKLKLNIPAAYYNSSFSVGNARHPASPLSSSQNPLSSHASRLPHDTFSPVNPEATTPVTYHSTGSGSETDSKRLSKRKRIPKKFYGDSSDEEAEHTPYQAYKWRKVTPASSGNSQVQSTVSSGFGYRGVTSNVPPPEPVLIQTLPPPDKSDDDDEEEEEEGGAGGGVVDDGGDGDESDSGHEDKRSSSDSSNSDSDNEQSDADSDVETTTTVTNAISTVSGNASQQKNENLYCYCQCPYDEVSEMIACDGKDCSIEWFHFECVGIMVPPKGKWFCPDCRKKTAARSEYLLHA